MANDHYISRFLTRPWESQDGSRDLHFYDFAKRDFDRKSSKRLFAESGLNTRDTEELLNRVIETPLAHYLDGTVGRNPEIRLARDDSWTHHRALAALWLLQVVRLCDGGGRNRAEPLDRVLERGERFVDELAQALAENSKLVTVTLPPTELLYFPESAYFPIPVIGRPPIAAVPLSPRHFFTAVDHDFSVGHLEDAIGKRRFVTCLSVGVGPHVHRTVLPPQFHDAYQQNREGIESLLWDLKRTAPQMINKIGELSLALGLRGFGVDPVAVQHGAAG